MKHGIATNVELSPDGDLPRVAFPASLPNRLSVDEPGDHWLLWQLADSAFPTGGFAHSGGVEAAFQQGELRRRDELASFIHASLCQVGHAMLPFAAAAHRNPAAFLELDRQCDSFTSNHVTNRASRLQGKALLATAEHAFNTPELRGLRHSVQEHSAFCHLAPVFGAIAHALAIPDETALRMFLFLHLRGLVSAAVRLGITGPLEGQAVQNKMAKPSEQIFRRSQHRSLDAIAQTAPLLELWQANQDRLYSRLFQS